LGGSGPKTTTGDVHEEDKIDSGIAHRSRDDQHRHRNLNRN